MRLLRLTLVLRLLGLAIVSCPLVCGCGPDTVNADIKPLEEPLAEEELRAFLSIVHALPGHKLPALPAAALEMPAWSLQRTLPVKELLAEQQKRTEDRRSLEAVVRHLQSARGLDRALRKEAWSPERFASVAIVLAAAVNRLSVTDEETMAQILENSEGPLHALEGDSRVLASLSDEAAYSVLDKARWIPLRQRVEWLSQVPPETLALVRERRTDLEKAFPADWLTNPFAPWQHILRNDGTPFEERGSSGSDASIPF